MTVALATGSPDRVQSIFELHHNANGGEQQRHCSQRGGKYPLARFSCTAQHGFHSLCALIA
jgi:hypothetical protein